MKVSFKYSKTTKTQLESSNTLSESPLHPNLFTKDSIESLKQQHDSSKPFKHVIISDLCRFESMRDVHKEATYNFTANFKESDLFKVYQTGDLGAIDVSDQEIQTKIPNVIKLRNALYSKEFRDFVQKITDCGQLTDRIDCSTNAYANSCHLLTHDDVIGTRRVSYIIYFSDPSESWKEEDGGSLELYPLDPHSILDRGHSNGGIQGVPLPIPSKKIIPHFNSMVLFVVQPGRSYHSVQEVFSRSRPRLSISGWYHATSPPLGSDQASLQQIMSKGDIQTPFYPILTSEFQDDELLSTKDKDELEIYINKTYLKDNAIKQINRRFIRNSSVKLKSFLRSELATVISQNIKRMDRSDKLGRGQISNDYSIGTTNSDWIVIGPPHKRRYLSYTTKKSLSHRIKSISIPTSKSETDSMDPGLIFDIIRKNLFRSKVFVRYVKLLTSLVPIGIKDEIRRFRPGYDYTVAYYGAMTTIPRLDATLCFVDEDDDVISPKKRPRNGQEQANVDVEGEENEEEKEEDDNDDEEGLGPALDLWEGGDVGGFECYIEADTKDTVEAAEVYQIKSNVIDKKVVEGRENRNEEDSLLSVSAENNVLSLVMRDQNVMRFIKYVSYNAPSSRWDISAEYELDVSHDDSDTEDDDV